jgi:type VI secretion system VasD/TssJ family lipoprotein
VFLHLYVLRDDSRFRAASYEDLKDHADATLGPTLIWQHAESVWPSSDTAVSLEVPADGQVLGAFAEFRDAEGRWRIETPPSSGGLTEVLRGHALTISVGRQSLNIVAEATQGK